MSLMPSLAVVGPSRRLQTRPAPVPAATGEQSRSEQIAGKLLQFLGTPGLAYRSRPQPFGGGWETDSYSLEFEPFPGLPRLLHGPLVLRLYATERGQPRARHEFAAQCLVHGRGFATARPALLVEEDDAFGAPFLLMERLPGQNLFDVFRQKPWRLWDLPESMAELHAELHWLSPDGFPDAAGDLLDRTIDEIRARVDAYHLEGLRSGLSWLLENRPRETEKPRILHLDWHPLNLIYSDNSLAAVDWTESSVGDRHADIATTLMTLQCYPAPPMAPWQRPFLSTVRSFVARRYLAAYRRQLPVDDARLRYYSAWICLRRLARYGRWFCIGSASSGFKPSALQHVGNGHCGALCGYFAQNTGVEVSIERP